MRAIASIATVTILIASLSACAEAPTSERPWYGYATNKQNGKLQWFFASYSSLEDCRHGTATSLEGVDGTWYKKPIGCGYNSGNKYVSYLYNKIVMGEDMYCLARNVDEVNQKSGSMYSPILRGNTEDKGSIWYCVW